MTSADYEADSDVDGDGDGYGPMMVTMTTIAAYGLRFLKWALGKGRFANDIFIFFPFFWLFAN